MKKQYEVYFLDDHMETFRTKKEAQDFIKECIAFDKRNGNPFGALKDNYEIKVVVAIEDADDYDYFKHI